MTACPCSADRTRIVEIVLVEELGRAVRMGAHAKAGMALMI